MTFLMQWRQFIAVPSFRYTSTYSRMKRSASSRRVARDRLGSTGSARGSGTALGGAGAAVLGAPRAGFAASELGAVEESLGRPTALWAEDLPGDR